MEYRGTTSVHLGEPVHHIEQVGKTVGGEKRAHQVNIHMVKAFPVPQMVLKGFWYGCTLTCWNDTQEPAQALTSLQRPG